PDASAATPPQGADDAKQPYQRFLVLTLDPGEPLDNISFTVPLGKRLVLEQASAIAVTPVGQKVTLSVATTGGGLNGRAWFVLTPQGTFSGLERFTMTQPLRMYADAGKDVNFQVTRSDSTATVTLNIGITGYLVDTP
ncbi:MAG TPA: hypothetical protein VGV59_06135, partial [Pyrinomonadaceae bacterium]|nr:hypothetical protein [Pyrinomonadaceae bacterium]